MNIFKKIPIDIVIYIMYDYMSIENIILISRTSKKFYQACENEEIWCKFLKRDYGDEYKDIIKILKSKEEWYNARIKYQNLYKINKINHKYNNYIYGYKYGDTIRFIINGIIKTDNFYKKGFKYIDIGKSYIDLGSDDILEYLYNIQPEQTENYIKKNLTDMINKFKLSKRLEHVLLNSNLILSNNDLYNITKYIRIELYNYSHIFN